jgi:hypothetical protein
MIEETDRGGLALAALALRTARLASEVRQGIISLAEMRAIVRDAHALVNDAAGFVADDKVAQAADDFLAAAEALAHPDALR